jgi:hypothetical protein
MSKGSRQNLERLLRSAWEQQIRLQARESMPDKTKNSGTPWYQSTLFWGAGPLGVAIVITVIAAMQKDFRWLLFLATPLFWISLWEIIKNIRHVLRRRMTFVASCLAVTLGLLTLFVHLAPKSDAPQQPPIHPYDLSEERRKQLLGLLSKPQSDPRETLRIGCISWSEESCIAAGKFLIVFSEAGWLIENKKIFREEPAVPIEGAAIVSRMSEADFKKTQALPPHEGIWQKMDASQQTIYWALRALQVPVGFSSDQSLPSGTIGVYFGPEPRQ